MAIAYYLTGVKRCKVIIASVMKELLINYKTTMIKMAALIINNTFLQTYMRFSSASLTLLRQRSINKDIHNIYGTGAQIFLNVLVSNKK